MTERDDDPSLIPPPPVAAGIPARSGADAEPDPALITLPPGLVDSATFKTAGPRPPRTAQRPAPTEPTEPTRASSADIVFFPAPPGADVPATATGPTQQTAPDPVGDDPVGDDPVQDTVMRPTGTRPTATHQWRLDLPDGSVELVRTTFVGRDPVTTPDRPTAALLALRDPAKSVSKTHALFEIDADQIWVHDLASTNGVWIAGDDDHERRISPGHRVRLAAGARVDLGDFPVHVRRG